MRALNEGDQGWDPSDNSTFILVRLDVSPVSLNTYWRVHWSVPPLNDCTNESAKNLIWDTRQIMLLYRPVSQ